MLTTIFENLLILAVVIAGLVTFLALGVFCAGTLVRLIRDRRAR